MHAAGRMASSLLGVIDTPYRGYTKRGGGLVTQKCVGAVCHRCRQSPLVGERS